MSGQAQKPASEREQTINSLISTKLQDYGYTLNEANMLLDLARQKLTRNIALDPVKHARLSATDVDAVAATLRQIKNSKPSELSVIVNHDMHIDGPQEAPKLRGAKPLPVVTGLHPVDMEGVHYMMQTNKPLHAPDVTMSDQERTALLRKGLESGDIKILAVTRADESMPPKQFEQAFDGAYARMQQDILNKGWSDRILVAKNMPHK